MEDEHFLLRTIEQGRVGNVTPEGPTEKGTVLLRLGCWSREQRLETFSVGKIRLSHYIQDAG